MKRKRCSNEQIAFALRQAEGGTAVEEICRKLGVAEATFYRWKKQFAGMGTVEIRRLKKLSWLSFGMRRTASRTGLMHIPIIWWRPFWRLQHASQKESDEVASYIDICSDAQ